MKKIKPTFKNSAKPFIIGVTLLIVIAFSSLNQNRPLKTGNQLPQEQTVDELIVELNESNFLSKKLDATWALQQLAEKGLESKSAGPIISRLLFSDNWDTRVSAAKTLGYIGYKDATPFLLYTIKEQYDWSLVYASIQALGRLHSRQAIPELNKLAKSHWYLPVRNMARKAIEVINGESQFERKYKFFNYFAFEFKDNHPIDQDIVICNADEVSPKLANNSSKMYRQSSPEEIEQLKYQISYYDYYEYDEDTGESVPKGNLKYDYRIPDVALKTNGGWFVGVDKGEWGGELMFSSDDGEDYKILDVNVRDIFNTPIGPIAIIGYSHLWMNYGKIYQLKKGEEGKWKATLYMTLPSAPVDTFQLKTGELLINTFYGSLIFTSNGNLKMASCPVSKRNCEEIIAKLEWIEKANAKSDVLKAIEKNDSKFIGDYNLGFLAFRGLSQINAEDIKKYKNYKIIDGTEDNTCSVRHSILKDQAVNYASDYNEWLIRKLR